MSVTVELTNDVAARCEQVLAEASGEGRALAWLFPDYDQALGRQKCLARNCSPLRLGCTVAAFSAWLDDCWGLYGDGRAFVASKQRQLLMYRTLRETLSFSFTPGTVELLSGMVQHGFGLAAFDAALRGEAEGLSSTEQRMVDVARAYRLQACEQGLVEPSEAMLHLAQCDEAAWPVVVCEGFTALTPSEAAFFASLSNKTDIHFVQHCAAGSRFDAGAGIASALNRAGACVSRNQVMYEDDFATCDELRSLSAALYYSDAAQPVQATGAVGALLPAGRYALPALLTDDVAAVQGNVLVVCANPSDMFEELAERLAACGVAVEASYARPFVQTDFGRAFLNIMGVLEGSSLDTFQATDFTMSVLTDMGVRSAYAFDAKWRSDRLTDKEGVLDDVCDYAPETAAPFVGLLEAGRVTEALDVAESRYRTCRAATEAFRSEQLAAVNCARSIFALADQLGEGRDAALQLLLAASLPVHVRTMPDAIFATGADGQPSCKVRIASYAEASSVEPRSFKVVYACSMNASEQSLKQNRTSVDELFAHLGCESARDVLFEARCRMACVIAAAREKLVLVRVLHDEKAEPTYPAVVFEDVVDCYRSRPTDASEPDKGTALHPTLVPFAKFAGEESFARNLSMEGEVPLREIAVGPQNEISSAALSVHLDPLRAKAAKDTGRIRWEGHESSLVLSPSALENYLDCPHKWFATRRLRLDSVDATFSAREKGTFIHEVLEAFYRRFAYEYVDAKPRTDQLAAAKKLLESVFAEKLAAQMCKDAQDNPFLPLTQAERREADALLANLKGFAERDANLMPGFSPQHFEYKFGKEKPFSYAGVMLTGSIDRIDVDEKGRAAVVDYKSSLGDAYFLLPSKQEEGVPFVLPQKVQTLVYAQVVRKELGLQPVAALYVHTQRPGQQPKVCGAYHDGLFRAAEDMLGINAKRNGLSQSGFATFEDLLDAVEDLIAQRLVRLAAGDIAVDPASDKVCSFCPVLSCEGRK